MKGYSVAKRDQAGLPVDVGNALDINGTTNRWIIAPPTTAVNKNGFVTRL
jgi:hypothetical protein